MSAQPGNQLSMASLHIGNALSAQRAGRWKHPWHTSVGWVEDSGWFATVKPGFVNESAPTVSITVEKRTTTGKDYGVNPLTGERYFSAHVFSQPTVTVEESTVNVPLYLTPAIPMVWRPIGFDGPQNSRVPQFFKERGVLDAPRQNTDFDETNLSIGPDVPKGLRLLRACDLVLHQPRLALTSEIQLRAGPVDGSSNVTQTLSVRFAAAGDRLRVFAGTFTTVESRIDPLAGVYEEDNFDERLISTVYLLSPPNAEPGSEPDGTWQPFVRHSLFWNLNYRQPELRILPSDPNTPFFPPLAGGAAQLVINFLTASLNDLTNQALNILTGHSLKGTFWTPTGGGHDATFPAELAPDLPKGGLDKARRLQAQRTAAAQARASLRLDPVFPYRTEPFNPAFLAA